MLSLSSGQQPVEEQAKPFKQHSSDPLFVQYLSGSQQLLSTQYSPSLQHIPPLAPHEALSGGQTQSLYPSNTFGETHNKHSPLPSCLTFQPSPPPIQQQPQFPGATTSTEPLVLTMQGAYLFPVTKFITGHFMHCPSLVHWLLSGSSIHGLSPEPSPDPSPEPSPEPSPDPSPDPPEDPEEPELEEERHPS